MNSDLMEKTQTNPLAADMDTIISSAISGLDFLVRTQCSDINSADCGRFVYSCDMADGDNMFRSTNWTTAICIHALLAGAKFTDEQKYLDSAELGIEYIKSLQEFSPTLPRCHGLFHEITPQTPQAHPRDALTAAWAMLDWGIQAQDKDAQQRAILFGEWFVNIAMEKGYPYWTLKFNGEPANKSWLGSFHCGSAFFMCKLFEVTGDEKYRRAMQIILDNFNKYHISEDGTIGVILDRETHEILDGTQRAEPQPIGWQQMHVYNDDFGALANLAAYKLEGKEANLQAAEKFLRRMTKIQRADGGFGPTDYSIPNAAGTILIEMFAGKQLGYDWAEGNTIPRAVNYLLKLQVKDENAYAYGAFHGFNSEYKLGRWVNMRTSAYAIQALLRVAGAKDSFCFIESE